MVVVASFSADCFEAQRGSLFQSPGDKQIDESVVSRIESVKGRPV